jgi:hypothetical protein
LHVYFGIKITLIVVDSTLKDSHLCVWEMNETTRYRP